jgi:hypothetical protein
MSPTLALAGDTMLGRGVADALAADPSAPRAHLRSEVAARPESADAVVINLECCVSSGGEPFPDRRKPFFFRDDLRVSHAAPGVLLASVAGDRQQRRRPPTSA